MINNLKKQYEERYKKQGTQCKPLTTGKHGKSLNGISTVELKISVQAKKMQCPNNNPK